jgi:FecR protein
MNRIKFWPYGALAVLAVAVVAGIGAALWFKYERSAQASSLPNAARIERVDGQVGINQTAENANNTQWIQATPNMPVSVGDRIYAKENSRAQLAFSGRNFATVEANTSLDVLDLSEGRTQVALREGSALFDVGSITSGQLFEVATPCGAVDVHQPGIYQITINENGSATATAYSGQADVVGQQGSGQIQKGESLAVSCQGGGNAVMSRVDADQAGTVIDNYYRYRYPRKYDGRYRSYYTYMDDHDPARQDASYNYVSDYVPGTDDLDDYGDWQYLSDYGYSWRPRVDNGWAPYQSGYWTMDYPYGLTWVSSEPWGYAPYHYGRWTNVSSQWYWVPETVNTYPSYSPALVAFIPFSNSSVAWVALGPGDPYVTRYYDPYWQPSYAYPSNVVLDRVVNIVVPGAVTVVPAQQFVSVIDPSIITRVDPRTFTRVRPVLDPLTVEPLRNVAFQTRAGRGRIDVPRQVEQRLENTRVIAANSPAAPKFRRDLARDLRVEGIADRQKKQKLQISDQRTALTRQAAQPPNIASEQARERQMADLAKQAARGDRNARQQMQELRRQQTAQPPAMERARVSGEAQGTRVAQPAQRQDERQQLRQQRQAQKEAARPQMINPQQQQRAVQQVDKRAQQRAVRSAPQPRVLQPQSQPQRRERKPPQYQRQSQPAVIQQPARAPRVERKAAPQPRMMRQPQSQPQPQAQRQAQPARQQQQPRSQPQQKPPGQQKAAEQKGGGKKKP